MRAIATAAIVAALTLSAAPASADLASSGLAPCVVEDQSTPCVWDARHRGNGHGRSFRVNRQGEVKFISHAQAHELMMGGPARDDSAHAAHMFGVQCSGRVSAGRLGLGRVCGVWSLVGPCRRPTGGG
jgi:hypothetical protein